MCAKQPSRSSTSGSPPIVSTFASRRPISLVVEALLWFLLVVLLAVSCQVGYRAGREDNGIERERPGVEAKVLAG